MEKRLHGLAAAVTGLLYIILAALVVGVVCIPQLTQILLGYFEHRTALMVFLYIGGILAAWMLASMIMIMHSVVKGNPFTRKTVRALRHIAISAGLALLDDVFLLIVEQKIPLVIFGVILLLGMLMAAVLSCVFAEAVFYKQENDLTV